MFGWSGEETHEFNENDTKETLHEVQPLGKILQNSDETRYFHKNFIEFVETQSFVQSIHRKLS